MKMKVGAILAGFALILGLFAWATLAGGGEVMGVIVRKGDAAVEVEDQSVRGGKIVVAKVVAPADSWVAVHLADGDMPGKTIGYVPVKAGVATDLDVPLPDTKGLTEKLIVVLHVDRGKPGEFEFKDKDPTHSPDRPYFVDGMEVAMAVQVR